MFRATNSPILRRSFWLYIQLLVQYTDTAADRCHGWNGTPFPLNHGTGRQYCRCIVPYAVYRVKDSYWGWANLSPETCRTELKRLINEKVVASRLLLTSLYREWKFTYKIFYRGSSELVGLGLLYEIPRSHWNTQHSLRLPWTSDRPVAGTSIWQHTTHKR